MSTQVLELQMQYSPPPPSSSEASILGGTVFLAGNGTWVPAPLGPNSSVKFTITLVDSISPLGLVFRLWNSQGTTLLYNLSKNLLLENSGVQDFTLNWLSGSIFDVTVDQVSIQAGPAQIIFRVTNNLQSAGTAATTVQLGFQVIFGADGQTFTSHDPQVPLQGYSG